MPHLSMDVEVDYKGTPTKELQDAISVALKEIGEEIIRVAQQEITNKKIWDRGGLFRSAFVNPMGLTCEAGFTAPYAPYVEYGTGPSAETPRPPYFPPFKPLYDWVKRNVAVRESDDNLVFKPTEKKGVKKLKKDEAEALTRKIQWNIFKYGIKPRPFFRVGLAHGEAVAHSIMKKHVDAAMAKFKEV